LPEQMFEPEKGANALIEWLFVANMLHSMLLVKVFRPDKQHYRGKCRIPESL
jgi:hypothetical protein